MPILSALDAISPAFARTKLVLFSPFRIGRTWKLAATAYLSVAGLVFLPMPLIYFFFLPAVKGSPGSMGATLISLGVLLLTVFFLWIFHLCSRVQFAFFDIVLNRGEFVAPAWRKYGPQSRKWSLVKALFGTIFTFALAFPIAGYARHIIPIMTALKPGQDPPPEFIGAFFAGYVSIFFGFVAVFVISSLISDFVVPSLALENTTLSEAFRRMIQLARNEPGQVTAYFFVKLGMGIAGYAVTAVAFEIVLLLVTLVVGLVLGLIGLILHLVGVPTTVLLGIGMVLLYGFEIVLAFYGSILVFGILITFLEAYKLYFLSGRYPMLGELLDRSTPPPTIYAPPPGYTAPYYPPPPAIEQ